MCRRRGRLVACSARSVPSVVLRRVSPRARAFPIIEPPLGENLRLTIVSTDENDPANKKSGNAGKNPDAKEGGEQPIENSEAAKNTADDHTLDTIRDMFAALRECWVPPPKDEARHGMEYTIRFAFKRDGERDCAAAHDLRQPRRAG